MILNLDQWFILFCRTDHLDNLSRGHNEEHLCEIPLHKFGPVVQKILSKDISYLQLWWPSSSAERNH